MSDPRRADLLSDLDRGEAEVLALAQEMDADLVIIDERLARRHAKRLGLALTGVLGVLLKAKERGLIPAIGPWVDRLRQGGIHLGDEIVNSPVGPSATLVTYYPYIATKRSADPNPHSA